MSLMYVDRLGLDAIEAARDHLDLASHHGAGAGREASLEGHGHG